jgi:hypothetical protein
MAAEQPRRVAARGLTARQTEEVRTRVRLMIQITARAGKYRKGLLAAAARLSPEEAEIISDLERHGLQVPQLHDVLCGGHVLVDDPQLYEDWRFTKVTWSAASRRPSGLTSPTSWGARCRAGPAAACSAAPRCG